MTVLSPILGWAADPIAVSPPSETPPSTVLLPLVAVEPAEPRSNTSLRSVLRQPFDDFKEDSKPYRLSVQERQRLREQLSGQSPYDPIKK